MDWRKHIATDLTICHGLPCFIGTRVMVTVVLDCLAAEMTVEDILAQYPSLSKESILASLSYSAELAKERIVAA